MFGEGYFPIDPDEEELQMQEPMNIDEFVRTEFAAPEEIQVEEEPPAVIEIKDLDEGRVFREPPEDKCVFYSVSGADPDLPRMYLRERALNTQGIADRDVSLSSRTFLEKPMDELHAIALTQSAKRDAELAKWLDAMASSVHADPRQFSDKYKPERFVDLLSDDSVNRQTMSWFCEWKKNLRDNGVSGSGTISEPLAAPEIDQNRKILILAGPPGVGKSALIEVCARHCSFSVVESNSSDERGKGAMLKLASDVCGNRSVLDASKPQLLLIEEVDSEECTAAEVLVDLIHKSPATIKRPIICVCTDVYRKNLKHLREVSTVLILTQPKPLRLCEKLKQICRSESLQIESLAIDRLVSLCDADIRSCLNQLQALASRAAKDTLLRVEDVMKYVGNEGRSVEAAVKDNQRSELELMQMIFEPKRCRTPTYPAHVAQAISQAKALPLEDIFAHCFLTVAFTDVSLRHTCGLVQLMSLGNLTLAFRYASHHCPAVGKPRIDLGSARKLIASRYSKRSERESVTAALIKASSHCVTSSKLIMKNKASWTLYASRILLCAISPEHSPVIVKKLARGVHPEIERIAKLYGEFGIELVEAPLDESLSQRKIYLLSPNLRLLSDLHEDQTFLPPYIVGSPLGELLRNQAKLQLTGALSRQDGSVELIARGKRPSIAPPVLHPNDMSKKLRSAGLSLSTWAGKGGEVKAGLILKRFPFEFRFNEGHTNAVKRIMHIQDFLPKRE